MSDLRDFVEALTYADMAANGVWVQPRKRSVIPGHRGNSNDPYTYQSDLVEAAAERAMNDPDKLAEILEDDLPGPLAEFLAYALVHWPAHKGDSPEPWTTLARAAHDAMHDLVWSRYKKEAGL